MVALGYRVYHLHDLPRMILRLPGCDTATAAGHQAGSSWSRTIGARTARTIAEDGRYRRFEAADCLEGPDDVATHLEVAQQESAEDPTSIPMSLDCPTVATTLQIHRRGSAPDAQRGSCESAVQDIATWPGMQLRAAS